MNTLIALALACTLSTAPHDDKRPSREPSTYVVTDKVAIWLTEAGKLKLSMGHQAGNASIELRDQRNTLYRSTVNLRKGIHQTFDLSQVTEGTYQILVTIGGEVIAKTIRIEPVQGRTVQLS